MSSLLCATTVLTKAVHEFDCATFWAAKCCYGKQVIERVFPACPVEKNYLEFFNIIWL